MFIQSAHAENDESEPGEPDPGCQNAPRSPEAGVQIEFCERMSYLRMHLAQGSVANSAKKTPTVPNGSGFFLFFPFFGKGRGINHTEITRWDDNKLRV